MPTPDKTIDVSKLVIEARQLASIHASYTFAGGDIGYVVKDRFITAIRALCDALESVAKENAELKEQRGKEANGYLKLINQVAHLDTLEAVTKERDALREALGMIVKPVIIAQLPKRVDAMTDIEHDIFKVGAAALGALQFVQRIARDALEKLNAK